MQTIRRQDMKIFVDPLLWFFIAQFFLLFFLWRLEFEAHKGLVVALFSMTVLLTVASLPIIGLFFKQTLLLETPSSYQEPQYIWVLSGGYFEGESPIEDMLNGSTYIRVAAGIKLKELYPKAKLVFAGGDYEVSQAHRMTDLMEALAIKEGVSQSEIIKEPYSRNTREHPIKALGLRGVTPHSKLMVVTTDWHLMRAKQEFDRSFVDVQYFPAQHKKATITWRAFIPSTGGLRATTTYLREWVGVLWYKLVALLKNQTFF